MTSRDHNIQNVGKLPVRHDRQHDAEHYGAKAAHHGDDAKDSVQNVVTRFAPSPNGRLHMGHAYAAIMAHDFARAAGGKFYLRIEDIDGSRSRREHIDAIIADMKWLGLSWDDDIIYQSQRLESYSSALEDLKQRGLVYPCVCTRSEIALALKSKPVLHGPDGPHYPQSCKGHDIDLSQAHCWRLDMEKAVEVLDLDTGTGILRPSWLDMHAGKQHMNPAQFGDVVLWRKDAPASYHLAATLDDAADGVTHIIRGQDLFAYSPLHCLLQLLLDLPQPIYWHHPLMLDNGGDKLSKSRNSASLSVLRDTGEDGAMLANTIRKGELPLGIRLSSD